VLQFLLFFLGHVPPVPASSLPLFFLPRVYFGPAVPFAPPTPSLYKKGKIEMSSNEFRVEDALPTVTNRYKVSPYESDPLSLELSWVLESLSIPTVSSRMTAALICFL